jgi:hypothetical protein
MDTLAAPAQISLDDARILLDLLRRALGKDVALMHDQDTLAVGHDHFHVVLDQHDGETKLAVEPRDGGAKLGVSCGFGEGSSSSRRVGSVATHGRTRPR